MHSAGYDLAGLFPKYVNYQRGTLICGLLCMAICPWRLLKSAGVFVAFLENFPLVAHILDVEKKYGCTD